MIFFPEYDQWNHDSQSESILLWRVNVVHAYTKQNVIQLSG